MAGLSLAQADRLICSGRWVDFAPDDWYILIGGLTENLVPIGSVVGRCSGGLGGVPAPRIALSYEYSFAVSHRL